MRSTAGVGRDRAMRNACNWGLEGQLWKLAPHCHVNGESWRKAIGGESHQEPSLC